MMFLQSMHYEMKAPSWRIPPMRTGIEDEQQLINSGPERSARQPAGPDEHGGIQGAAVTGVRQGKVFAAAGL